MNEINFEILDIGLYYIAHFNLYQLKLFSDNFSLAIPLNRLNEFIQLFPDINWEDGYMFHKLKGRYLRAVLDNNGKLVQLKHIVKPIVYEVTGI